MAPRPLGPLPQERARLLDQADHPRRPQPASPAEDRGGEVPGPQAGAVVDRGVDDCGAGAGELGGGRISNPRQTFSHGYRVEL